MVNTIRNKHKHTAISGYDKQLTKIRNADVGGGGGAGGGRDSRSEMGEKKKLW